MMRVIALAVALLFAQAPGLPGAQAPQAGAPRIFLMTMGPGDAVWERFGHNGIVIEDASFGSYVFDWGRFSFDQPGFVPRLMKGRMQYWTEGAPTQLTISHYAQMNRSVWLQELNLTPEQAIALRDFVLLNQQEANKFYRYDYYRDNCSTRVRDMIDYALGGALKVASQDTTDLTYRGETVRLLDDLKLTQFGTDVALGRPADRRLTRWEAMFIPMRMRDALNQIQLRDSTGATKPIVAREQILYQSQSHHERPAVPRLWIPYLVIGLLLAIDLFVMGWLGGRSGALEKTFRFGVAVWSVIAGLLGAIVLAAWALTEHTFWFRNENLLLFNPLSLFLAVLAPLSIWRPRFTRAAAIVAIVVAMLGAIALLAKGLPWSQENLALIALMLPVHFVIAYHLWLRAADAPTPAAA